MRVEAFFYQAWLIAFYEIEGSAKTPGGVGGVLALQKADHHKKKKKKKKKRKKRSAHDWTLFRQNTTSLHYATRRMPHHRAARRSTARIAIQ